MSSIKEIVQLFRDGKLRKEDGDIILIDGTEVILQTDKSEYSFSGWAEDIVFDLLDLLDINVDGV
jgi:hypothetical protein